MEKGLTLLKKLVSKRDYSGSESDRYAQTLNTMFLYFDKKLFPLLEKAEKNGKKLAFDPAFIDFPSDSHLPEHVIEV